MIRNTDLLLRTLQTIQKNPKNWNQRNWVSPCGTAFCYAGHAAILAGAQVPSKKDLAGFFAWVVEEDGSLAPEATDRLAYLMSGRVGIDEDGLVSVSHWATEKLGISSHEATWLFDGDNPLEYIEAAVHALVTGGHIEPETGNVYTGGKLTFDRDNMETD